mmetsp:Transcript_9881/g.12838  ORF Transcript_9881/g.12838 Transcript_9881/m.12838 type:complete len:210 (+) Transcript_9881:182-811(+)
MIVRIAAQLSRPVSSGFFCKQGHASRRCMSSLSFASPRNLNEILKMEMIEGKSKEDIEFLWNSYHENKEGSIGLSVPGIDVTNVLERASENSFFIQPIFREEGFFNLMVQFQQKYFLLCLLEEYQQNPAQANSLITLSIFDDLVSDHDLGLVRGDIINKGITEDEGRKIVTNLFDIYAKDDSYEDVIAFNKKPDTFDFNDFISRQKQKW